VEEKPGDEAPLILIIDDTEDNREVYIQFFRHQGWRVVSAEDGIEGLRMAAEHVPSVIVLDLGLPKMDGWQVAGLHRPRRRGPEEACAGRRRRRICRQAVPARRPRRAREAPPRIGASVA